MTAQPVTRTIVLINGFQEESARVPVKPGDCPFMQDLKADKEKNNFANMQKIAPQIRAFVDSMRTQNAKIICALTHGDANNPFPSAFKQQLISTDLVLYADEGSVYAEHQDRFQELRNLVESRGEKLRILFVGFLWEETLRDLCQAGFDVEVIGGLTLAHGRIHGSDAHDTDLAKIVSSIQEEMAPQPQIRRVGQSTKRQRNLPRKIGFEPRYKKDGPGPTLRWLGAQDITPALEEQRYG